ncbi:hypothetical protein RDABS01_031341 [Bienertia sinuspersici]
MSFMDLLFENDIDEMHLGVNLSIVVNANDVDFDENGSDNDDDEIINARNMIEEEKRQQNLYNNELLMLQKLAERQGTNLNLGSDFDGDNSDYESPNESSDEEDCEYLIPPKPLRRNGSKKKDVDYKKNDKTRIVADYKVKGCPWNIGASWDGRKRTFKVKTHNPTTLVSTKKPKRKITNVIFNQNIDIPENQNHHQPKNPPNGNATAVPTGHQHNMSFKDIMAADHNNVNNHIIIDDNDDDLSDDDELSEVITDDPKCPIILLTEEEKKRMKKPWKHALIIKMFDGKIGYMSLMKRSKKKWELKGGLTLTDIGYDYFIARFSSLADYNHVLTQGPWMLDDNYLTIRKWVPNFVANDAPMRFLTIRVRIPHLSVEYFNKEFLTKIGGKIGKVIRIDKNTSHAERGQFTRLSIEIDLSKPLLSKFWLKGKIWKILYEGLRMICFKCGKIGHSKTYCHDEEAVVHVENPMEQVTAKVPEQNSVPHAIEESRDFGSWMFVKKPPPRQWAPRPEKPPEVQKNHPLPTALTPREQNLGQGGVLLQLHPPRHLLCQLLSMALLTHHPTCLHIPPEKILVVGDPMTRPYLGITDPLTHKLEMEIHSWTIPSQEKPELVVTLKLPNDIKLLMNYLSDAYKSAFPSSAGLMSSDHNLVTNLPPITCMVWNAQGVGSREFLSALQECTNQWFMRSLKLMWGDYARKISTTTKYSGVTRVDPLGFSGGIWLFWKPELVHVGPINNHNQYITIKITRQGDIPWYFTAIYASPDPSKRQDLWDELHEFARQNNKPWLLAGDFNETDLDGKGTQAVQKPLAMPIGSIIGLKRTN